MKNILIRMNVLILTEGGQNKGLGHIARCSSIYNSFKDFNIEPKFIVNGDESTDEFLSDFDFLNLDWINNQDYIFDLLNEDDIVIIDSYLASEKFYEEIADKVSLGVYLDDNNRLEYPKGILLNGTILANDLGYSKNVEREDLLGSEYILLRKSFENVDSYKINSKINNILITLGGDDFRNLTPKILDLLDSSLNKTVIIGNSFKNIDEIKQFADENTELLYNLNDEEMLKTMLKSDVAISSSGQTLYEFACVGVPTIAIGVIDNQINNIENWQKQGFIEFAGFWDDDKLLDNIESNLNYLNDFNLRKDKKDKGNSAVDGKGSKRLIKKILSNYYRKNSVLRLAKKEDCYKIFEIANDHDVREASYNSEKIPLENHRQWFNDVIHDSDVLFFVLEYEDDIIGQVRFNLEKEGFYVVSISLNKKYRGLGLSIFLLSNACRRGNFDSDLVAYIKKENKSSIALFEHCGFKLDCHEEINGCESLRYVLRG